jgi:hypothetical protein
MSSATMCSRQCSHPGLDLFWYCAYALAAGIIAGVLFNSGGCGP